MEDVYLGINRVSIVVPVYNGANTIEELYQRIDKVFKENRKDFQLIFVDDYSSDKSWEIIKKIKLKDEKNIVGIRLSKNFGQHNATLCGILRATGNWVVTIDDDLEFNPEDIFLLAEKQKETGADLIYGVDFEKKQSLIKRVFGGFYKRITRFLEGEDRAKGSSIRFMKVSLAKAITKNARNFSFIDEFIIWHTSNISAVSVSCSPSKNNKSRYSFWRLSILTKELVFFSSITPLRVVTLLGTVMAILNFLWGGVILFRKFVLFISVEGYTSIIVAILFSSGLIIFSIGILAEYISKILKMNYDKPSFKEAEVL